MADPQLSATVLTKDIDPNEVLFAADYADANPPYELPCCYFTLRRITFHESGQPATNCVQQAKPEGALK